MIEGSVRQGAGQAKREVHHQVPRCLLRLRDRADAHPRLDGDGVQKWLDWELEALSWGVTPTALADRQSGKVEVVTLWESEEAMRHSEEEADQLRGDTARATGGAIAGVERYEVVLSYTL